MKNKTLKTLLFVLCFASLLPNEVEAKEKTANFTIEGLKEAGKKILDKVVEANEAINEKISEIAFYKQESLWLITDIPNVDPSEERNYYFVDTNPLVSFGQITLYYNQYGDKVSKNDPEVTRKVERTMYPYLTIEVEKTFYMEYEYDLVNNTITTNFVDFNEDYFWDSETLATYGRIVDVSKVIPEDMQKSKYSDEDLTEILNIINDPDYELFENKQLKREKK